jgi:acetylglutamate kinase
MTTETQPQGADNQTCDLEEAGLDTTHSLQGTCDSQSGVQITAHTLQDKIVVIKYGGSTIQTDSSAKIDPVILDIAALKAQGLLPVVVHGGGKAITEWLGLIGHESHFVDGRRVTDDVTLNVVEMVLGGLVNKQLVAAFCTAGCPAVGLSGVDGGLLQVVKREHPGGDLGWVGDVAEVRAEAIFALLEKGFVPVIAPFGADAEGQRYNVNADSAAGAIAAALGAEKMVLLTDVPGILRETKGSAGARELIPAVTPEGIAELIADGTISGGMIPKVEACLNALAHGAGGVQILDGRAPHALLSLLLEGQKIGTLIRGGDTA